MGLGEDTKTKILVAPSSIHTLTQHFTVDFHRMISIWEDQQYNHWEGMIGSGRPLSLIDLWLRICVDNMNLGKLESGRAQRQ